MISASIVGGSGYTGGEVLRLLLFHPQVQIRQVVSPSNAGKFVSSIHPNLNKITNLKFITNEELETSDVLFLCLPHGTTAKQINSFKKKSDIIIDLSSDFRLKNPRDYNKWYQFDHPNPEYLNDFVYGLPEIYREQIKLSKLIACGGCNATASILGLYPLFKHNIVKNNEVIIEVKVGSSEGGKNYSLASHHPERSGAIRSYKPVNHRHTAEIIQALSINSPVKVHMSATTVELVRGLLATCHVFIDDLSEKDIWKIYRKEYGQEPFIRIVKKKEGVYRYPEPKLLAGTNYCDIGFELDTESNRLVVISAIDNLVKGSAGQAIQSMNLIFGLDESMGLDFCGLHPI